MTSAKCFAAVLVLMSLGQNTRGAQAPRRVVNAYCDSAGAHVAYDRGAGFVQKAKPGEQCSDMKVSANGLAVGWLMVSQATVEAGNTVVQRYTHSDLFVNGVLVTYPESGGLYEWRFYNDGRQVVFLAGPLTGEANVFLYDIDRKQVVDECNRRQAGVICADWAK